MQQNPLFSGVQLPDDSKPSENPAIHNWQWFRRLNIGKKISLGYAVSLGIAVLGTGMGIGIAELLHEPAVEREEQMQEVTQTIYGLQRLVNQTELSQYRLIATLEKSESITAEYKALQTIAAELDVKWQELEKEQKAGKIPTDIHSKGEDEETLKNFMSVYKQVPKQNFQNLERVVKALQTLDLQSAQGQAEARKVLISFLENSQDFSVMSAELTELATAFYDASLASEKIQEEAGILRLMIIVASLLGSVAIAALLAFFTAKMIARPVQSLTAVAKESLDTGNFTLQAPVLAEDEVGTLTVAVNQFISGVHQLLEERKASEARLIQTEKMSSLGQMVAGIAHEINNPVNFIHVNISHVEGYLNDLMELISVYRQQFAELPAAVQQTESNIELEYLQDDLTKMLASMSNGTRRIADIVTSLRNFSHLDESDYKAVNIHEGIDSTLMILQSRLNKVNDRPEIEVVKHYHADLPLIECYPRQLNQVFMNLLNNSIDAIDERFLTEPGLQPKFEIHTEMLSAHQVAIRFVDNGCGISAEIKDKLFDPFFTTKQVGKGTGLGLTVNYQIITEVHGGELSHQSTVGSGTEFLIKIPTEQVKANNS
jgi:two-component system, NtrC family, sensor kinase